ncbi:MAG: PQQ-binding-like beta-propeller repeat protein [Candidatus Bathyarchaeota archaeon]|nr:PQQ-binding-like beta-propeller repeat protein [Candidatus Termiticorpusculum sp.]
MKIFKNKNLFSALAVLLVLSFAVSMFALPGITNAQTTRDIPTFPFVDAIPRPAGVGQSVLINFGLLNYLAMDGDGWNITLTITDPSGKITTIDKKTWSTGTVGYSFTPDAIGTYQLQCTFKGEYYNSPVSNVASGFYMASKSDILKLEVQEDPKPNYPGHLKPAEYWLRPIDSQLREWWSIAGSWVSSKPSNLYAPWNNPPASAHILWTMPMGDTMGGLSGGNNGEIGYQNGDAYEGKFVGAIILSGVLYYNRYVANSPTQAIIAVDLHTGKVLWERSYDFGGSRISTGQILTWISLNNRGTWAYIWMTSGTNMFALDAKTGDLKYNMTNVPSGTIYYGSNGEMLKYQLVNYGTAETPNWHLLQWNSSYVVTKDKIGMAESWGSQVQGVSYNATERGYDINVSLPITNSLGSIITAFPTDRIIVGSASDEAIILSAISLKSGDEGRMLFQDVTWPAPPIWKDITSAGASQAGWAAFSQVEYVGVYWTKENRVNYAFSLETGKFMWQADPQIYADAWGGPSPTSSYGPEKIIAYGRLFESSVGGIVYCYNVTTGELLWTHEETDRYTESYLTANWQLSPLFISDHKIYYGHIEHSAQEPKPRGAPFFALNVETGEVIWEIFGAFRQTGWGGRAILGDSIIATMDTYDQQIYAIGKGPSAMTLSAPDFVATANTPVIIRGTIMDVSPGTQSDMLQLRFPNGVPAVSDESMSEWMLYVYKQFERPSDIKGVPIVIDAIDPTGEYVTLGTATSDASGKFVFEFKPTMEGTYTIYTYFDGSASYYGSWAQEDMIVMAAADTTTNSNNSPYELYIIGMGIAVIIAVLLVGLWIKKK